MSRWMLGLSRKDRVRNEGIRKRLGTTEMGKWCRQARLRWYGHVKRREDDYVGRRAMGMRIPGQRERQTKEEVVGLHQGRHGGSWCEQKIHKTGKGGGGWSTWQQPHNHKWDKLQEEEEELVQLY